jgi:hypothetical protein
MKNKETLEEAGMYQQELFNYLYDLGVTALQSEMQEIERIVLNMQQEQDKNKYSKEDLKQAFEDSRKANIFEENKPPLYKDFEEWINQLKDK